MRERIELSQAEAIEVYADLDQWREVLEADDQMIRALFVAGRAALIWDRLQEDG